MPDDSNGIYNVPNGTLVNSGDTVLPSQHNPWANDSATAISNRYSKDGRAPLTGNMNANGFLLRNIGTPIANGDAATKQYADNANPNNIYTLVAVNTAVDVADKGRWYRTATAGIVFTPASAATLGANHFFRVKNDSTGIVTIDPTGSETINGSSSLFLPSGQEIFVISDGVNLFATIYSNPQQGPQLQGYLSGLQATANTVSPTTNIDIAVGVAANNSSPYYLMQLVSSITKNTNISWAAGNGQGSLDTGIIGNNQYYGFLIQRSDTGVVDILTSLSSTAPTMPANYDRRSPALFRFTRTSGVNSTPVNLSPVPAKFYESDPQTITVAGLLTLPHGMAAPPKMIAPALVCVVAENGYSVGDAVPASTQTSTSTLDSYGASFEYGGATNILVRYGSGSSGNVFIITHKTTGVPTTATSANWRLVMRAWA